MDKTESLLQLFPESFRPRLCRLPELYDQISEIRIRVGQPVFVKVCGQEKLLLHNGQLVNITTDSEELSPDFIVKAKQMEQLISHLCRYSPYAYQEELKQGYLTMPGGHRIGIAGQVLQKAGEIEEMRFIRFLNIRVCHEIFGAADLCMQAIYSLETKQVKSCLIIAPPGQGKTTLLRDLIRQVSNGGKEYRGRTVGVVDERSELAGAYRGIPQNDLGQRTDVLDQCPKSIGMLMLLRTMAPEVIAIDEIATKEDVESLLLLLHCGVKVFVTIHGTSLEEVRKKPFLRPLFSYSYFEVFFVRKEDNWMIVNEVPKDTSITNIG